MGENFSSVYKILRFLDRHAGDEDCDIEEISAEQLGISENKWEQLMIELAENGYIRGVSYFKTLSGKFHHLLYPLQPNITLKGMEYLEENGKMKKAAEIVSGIIDVVK